MTELVRAWNGKWHIFERDTRVVPYQPVSAYNRVAKPERQQALAGCGIRVFVLSRREVSAWSDLVSVTGRGFNRDRINMCKNCRSVLIARYPKPAEPVTWSR